MHIQQHLNRTRIQLSRTWLKTTGLKHCKTTFKLQKHGIITIVLCTKKKINKKKQIDRLQKIVENPNGVQVHDAAANKRVHCSRQRYFNMVILICIYILFESLHMLKLTFCSVLHLAV